MFQFYLLVPTWSSVHVAGTKLKEINLKMGENNDPERWHEMTSVVNEMESKLNIEKGEKEVSCWCLALCTAEIVDAILRNTKVVLPVATYIHVRKFQHTLIQQSMSDSRGAEDLL